MASISSMMADNPYEQLIQSIIAIEKQPKLRMVEQRTEKERMKGVLGDFESKLSALQTAVKKFTDTLNPLFNARTATGGGESYGVSAGDKAVTGSHSVQVLRLASVDTRLSKQITGTGTSFSALAGTTQSFKIGVGSTKDPDAGGRQMIDISVDIASDATDEDVLKQIAEAVNSAMDAAVEDGTIRSTERASMSVIREAGDALRLSLRSGQTGFDNRLTFEDTSGLLAQLDLATDQAAAGTSGGYVTEVGTSAFDSKLNSAFVLDGLTLYRNGNQVNDALDGVTITLKQPDDVATDFTVSNDQEAVKKEIESFIGKYNDLLSFIEKKSAVDADANTRGDFAGDTTIRGLRFSLRNDLIKAVPGQPEGTPSMLSDIGITIEKNGTLKLSDPDKLAGAIENNPSAVQQFFGGDDGIARRVENRVDAFLGIDGMISSRKKTLDESIKQYKTRETRFDEQLKMREEMLRAQYASFQETIALLQGQQQMLFGYMLG